MNTTLKDLSATSKKLSVDLESSKNFAKSLQVCYITPKSDSIEQNLNNQMKVEIDQKNCELKDFQKKITELEATVKKQAKNIESASKKSSESPNPAPKKKTKKGDTLEQKLKKRKTSSIIPPASIRNENSNSDSQSFTEEPTPSIPIYLLPRTLHTSEEECNIFVTVIGKIFKFSRFYFMYSKHRIREREFLRNYFKFSF